VKVLRWRRGPTAWSNLHHMVGFWICVPLAVLSLTGSAIAFPEAVRLISGAPAAKGPQRPQPAAALPNPHLAVDDALAAARALVGPGEVQQIQLPTPGKRPAWTIQIKAQGRTSSVKVDDATGAARPQPQRDAPQGRGGGDPLMRLMRQLHNGGDTGPIWPWVIFTAGLAPALLGLTGVVIWLQRRGRKRAAVAAAA
jgi:uncharacterized iron-regulated membrane protein